MAIVPSSQETRSMMDEVLGALNSSSPEMRIAGLTQIYKMADIAGSAGLGHAVVALLDDSVTSVQVQALLTLRAMGAASVLYGTNIVAKLSSQQKEVKRAAIQALGGLGEEGVDFVRDVEPLLSDSDLDIVADACVALGMLKATELTSALVAKLKHGDIDVVCGAISGLGYMGAELAEVGGMLSQKEPRIKAAALAILCHMDGSEKYADEAAKCIGDSDGWVRNQAATLITILGDKASSEVAKLGSFLTSQEIGVKAAAAAALAGIGEDAASQIDALEKLLTESGEDTSTIPLVKAGVAAKVESQMRKPACAAAYALGSIGVKAAGSAASLAEGLKTEDDEIKIACAKALGKMGAGGSKFEAAICALLDYHMPMVVIAGCNALADLALAGLPSTNGADKAATLLADKHPGVRQAAAECLALQGEMASVYIEELVKALSDPIYSVKAASITAVAACGEIGQMYASRMCQLMFDASPDVRIAACNALKNMDERGAAFAEEVSSLLEDDIPEVRDAAVSALSSFKTGSAYLPEGMTNALTA